MSMFDEFTEPFHMVFLRQNAKFEFWPSKGIMRVSANGKSFELDMKDVFMLEGWIGSMIIHYFDEVKKGNSKHSKEVRKIMKASEQMSKLSKSQATQIEHKEH